MILTYGVDANNGIVERKVFGRDSKEETLGPAFLPGKQCRSAGPLPSLSTDTDLNLFPINILNFASNINPLSDSAQGNTSAIDRDNKI